MIRAASTLRFLGTEAILTGLRPEIAQTLVNLGVDLGALTTHGTLQSAVAYALARAASRARVTERPRTETTRSRALWVEILMGRTHRAESLRRRDHRRAARTVPRHALA